MSKLKNIFVVAESKSATAELIAGAVALGENTVQVRCDISEAESFLSYIPPIVSLIKEKHPQLVLVEATKNGRLAAAAIAAAVGTSVMTDVSELTVKDGAVVGKRMVYGGAAFKTEKVEDIVAVVCMGAGVFEAEPDQAAAAVIDIQPEAAGVQVVEKRPKKSQTVNLAEADVIVGVGRGLGKEENLQLAKDFAAVIGGEVGCTRPIAEEEKWLPKETYIGISGAMLKPEVYIGCGISGQVQHMVGVDQAKVIVAVNKDKNAPIFKQCDYGIVGDLAVVLPALTEKFMA